MHPRTALWLEDVLRECAFLRREVRTLDEFLGSDVLRRATERSLEIIGEAMLRIERDDPATANRVTDYRRIIGLRNRIAHEYDDLEDAAIWVAVMAAVSHLDAEVALLLTEADATE